MQENPIKEVFIKLANGNPGAAQFLVNLAKEFPNDFSGLAMIMARNHLTGSRVYMLWNDANNRDTAATVQLLLQIGNGRLPMAVVEKHLNEGWCRPFTPDEYLWPGDRAVCPRFYSRVDYQNNSAIQCHGQTLVFSNRQQRDAHYHEACCENPNLCMIRERRNVLRAEVLPMWPDLTKEDDRHE
ncbi:MAG: hypothetical protein IKK75_07460 [Clostridia bacterium]|nr:hypothetical protein [Clostridia bacterium]